MGTYLHQITPPVSGKVALKHGKLTFHDDSIVWKTNYTSLNDKNRESHDQIHITHRDTQLTIATKDKVGIS